MEHIIKEAIIEPLKNEKIDLLNVYLGVEDNQKTLFITIDSKDGVDNNLCQKAMKIVKPIIDELNLNLKEYILDVGSKGE